MEPGGKMEIQSHLEKMEVKEVKEYIYWGALIANKMNGGKEIDRQMMVVNRCAGELYHMIRTKEVAWKGKIRLYQEPGSSITMG